jgi:hypothetical protein
MAPDYTDLVGRKFGKLTVLALSRFGAGGKVRVWRCACDCGSSTDGWTQKLTNGSKTSCGCDDPRRYARLNGRPSLTAERLREVLDYDRDTGALVWRVSLGGKGRAGQRAGVIGVRGHRAIAIDGRLYRSARLCWMHVNGTWPDGLVDHKNTDPADDRWENLREATHAQNSQNSNHPLAMSGLKGAYETVPGSGKWFSSIGVDGKRIGLGSFNSKDEAHAAYVAASRKYHGEFSRIVTRYAEEVSV